MNKLFKNQKGFSVIEVLLVILLVALMSFAGYYVWHAQHDKAKFVSTTSKTNSKTKTSTTTSPDLYAGWKTYTLPVKKLSFKYPSDWAVNTANSIAPSSTQDELELDASDGLTFNITDGVSNGGDALIEAPSDAVPVTFEGQTDYLVPRYARGSVGQGSSNGMIGGAVLQTSNRALSQTDSGYPWIVDKNAVGPNDTNGTLDAKYMFLSFNIYPPIKLQEVSNNADFKTAGLVIASMHY